MFKLPGEKVNPYGLYSNMKMVVFIVLTCCIPETKSTILAATGYIASSSPVRNSLISSGIGSFIQNSATALYDASGFRFASDQGTNVRKAVMKNHTIVEIGENSRLNDRKGEVSISDKSVVNEDRMYSERLFGVLNQMDKNACISRLLCEIGSDPISFGAIGLKINHYIRSVPPVTWNSATFPYVEAFQAGSKEGIDNFSSEVWY
ncbi:uncharacterized protein TNIN_159951 [Trichonephila inaurata madagascariensis]|uniref:Uncharacterized protein n=1 Tax=Trichonephila inaurata madagascariensis TaxID=2747483 RepID=A0A8X6XPR6_9ARAC|nr:uncharacterized protein TNIN_159951 [Trichonephila inaurata madagascariensis]